MSDDLNRKRRKDLGSSIQETLDLIKQYEDKQRLSNDPKEQRDCERQIGDLREMLKKYGAELAGLEKATELPTSIEQEVEREWILEDLPPTPMTFIGREREKREFERTLARILIKSEDGTNKPDSDWAHVFLIRGEGGMGKSTLLGEYVQVCQRYEKELFAIYIDWESASVDSDEGTPKLMQVIAMRFQKKYQIEFRSFRTVELDRLRISKHIEALRADFRGSSEEEFSQNVKTRISEIDFALYDPRQRQRVYSEAFINDLIQIASTRPVILMFDTYETVWQFADEWLRGGLYRYCLKNPEVGRQFVFVVAGRLPDEVEFRHRDDARQYSHSLAYLHFMLDKFTITDIREYLRQVIPGKQISDPVIERIRVVTQGIPLAVNEVATIIKDEGDVEQIFGDIREPVTEQKVIGLVTSRFLKHCFAQQAEDRNKERDCIYTFAVLRESDADDTLRRTKLLRDIWFRCGLIRSTEEFSRLVRHLQQHYSFLFLGNRMHPDVRFFIQKALRQGGIDLGRLLEINEVGKTICELKLKERLKEIESQHDREKAEREKYRDLQWQDWLLDLVNHHFWLQEYDVAMELLINAFVMGMQHGSNRFHWRLLRLVQNDIPLYDCLPDRHKVLVHRLANLKEWFGSAKIKAERDELLNSLRGEAQLAAHLIAARAAIANGAFEVARSEVAEAERLYQGNNEKNSVTQMDLAETYHLLGRRLAQSSRKQQVQQECLLILRKANEWSPNNPHILCALGNVLINSLRLEEAKLTFQRALMASKELNIEVQQGLDRVKRLEGIGALHPKKEARILTAEGNVLGARGEFGEAEKLFRAAMRSDPLYVPARVKLSHLLRQVGRLDDAYKLLDEVQLDSLSSSFQRAIVYDAYGALHLACKQFDRAAWAYQSAISLSPDYINPHNGLGRIYIRVGRVEEAIGTFNHALTIKRSSKTPLRVSLFWVYNNLGIAYLFGDQANGAMESFQIAEFLCKRYLEMESRQYYTWSNLGMALLGQNRYGEALEAFGNFSQRCKARGIVQELLDDIELIGQRDKTTGWQQISTFVASLL